MYSSLKGYKAEHASVFATHFLPSTITPFNQYVPRKNSRQHTHDSHSHMSHRLRRDTHRTIAEIQKALGSHSSLDQGPTGYEKYFDLERQQDFTETPSTPNDLQEDHAGAAGGEKGAPPLRAQQTEATRPPLGPRMTSGRDLDNELRLVSARLEAEAERHGGTRPPSPSIPSITVRDESSTAQSLRATMTPGQGEDAQLRYPKGCARRLRMHFEVSLCPVNNRSL